jgi:high-affinity Fe2+/Pb2+ permease
MRFTLKALARRHTRQFIILLGLAALMYGGSNAKNVPSLLLMVGFLLLLGVLYHFFYGLLSLAGLYGLKLKRQNRFALCFTGVTGLLVALQSIGELSPRDVVVLLPLAGLAYIYSSYGASEKRNLNG